MQAKPRLQSPNRNVHVFERTIVMRNLLFCSLLLVAAAWPAVAANNLLRNADFKSGLQEWELPGESARAAVPEADALAVRAGNGFLLIQRNLPLTGNEIYRVSFTMTGAPGSEYRSYVEWAGGGAGQFNMCAISAGTRGVSYYIKYPSNVGPPYLVIQLSGATPVSLRQLRVEHCAATAGAPELGGRWLLPPTARQTAGATSSTVLELAAGPSVATLGALPLTAGQRYRLSFRAQGIGTAGTTTGYFPLRVEVVGTAENLIDDTWNASAQSKQLIFTAPSKSVTIQFSTGAGTIRFSDFALAAYTEAAAASGRMVLTTPSYRGNLYASLPTAQLAGILSAAPAAHSAAVELLDGRNTVIGATVSQRAAGFRFALPVAKLAVGDYRLRATFRDVAGTVVTTTELPVRRLAPAPVEVVIGTDLNCYINGKQFLPILFWTPPNLEPKVLRALAAAGVNTYFINVKNAEDALKGLNTAHAAGFNVILSSFTHNPPSVATGPEFEKWQKLIAAILTPEVLAHPALLTHFLADEPGWTGNSPPALLAAYRYYCQIDPYHPVWINAGPRGSVADHRRYSEAADIYGLDIYPVPPPNSHSDLEDKGLTSIGAYTQQMREAVAGRKPIWMVLQGFNWLDLMSNKLVKTGYPTRDQSRFAAFQAFSAGAQAATWWGVNFALLPEFIDELLEVTREMHDLSGLLTHGNWRVMASPADTPYVQFREITLAKDRWLLVMNGAGHPVKTTVPGTTTTLDLPAYGVRLLGDAPLPPPVNPPLVKMTETSPFAAMLEPLKHRRYFATKAMWIWEASQMAVAGSKVWLGCDFVVERPVAKAEILITADDSGELWLNGKTLGATGGITALRRVDIAGVLKPGSNQLRVTAEDCGGLPCGLLAELTITYQDGSKQVLLSNDTWSAARTRPPDFPAGSVKTPGWSQAGIVCAYGGNAWGNNVFLPEE